MARLGELARLVRSKNAGPFLVTFDIMFEDRATFAAVKAAGVLCPELIARVYGLAPNQVKFIEYEPGLAFKATIPRLIPSGDPLDTDIYAAQQHGPLVNLEIPIDLHAKVGRGS